MTRQIYTITVDVPAAEDQYDYTVTITRQGKPIAAFTGPLAHVASDIGGWLMEDLTTS